MQQLAALIQSCVRGYTLSLLLAFRKDFGHSKLIPKGSGIVVSDPIAPSRPCCGKTRQSKKLLSTIIIVQSRISGNLLSTFSFRTEMSNIVTFFNPLANTAKKPRCNMLRGCSKDHSRCVLWYDNWEQTGFCPSWGTFLRTVTFWKKTRVLKYL